MNQCARGIPLALAAVMLLAATCVGETRQRGPAGPWVGEVVNYGPDPAPGVAVRANIFDATGAYLGLATVFTCPSTVPPRGRAAFEVFFHLYSEPQPPIVPPLRAEFERVALEGQMGAVTGEGLSTRVISSDAAKRVVLAEVRNDSAKTYWQSEVCATLRSPSGALLEVGHARLFPSVLRPGESQTVTVYFNSMPAGDVALLARGQDVCCPSTLTFGPAEFNAEISRVFAGNLLVTGEFTDRAGQDLSGVRLVAYVDGAPETRTEASLGCAGYVRRGDVAPAVFGIPLTAPAPATPRPVIVGIEAQPAPADLIELPVADIAGTPWTAGTGLRLTPVRATVSNPRSEWMGLLGVCVTLRDSQGRVVGAGRLAGDHPSLAPGASLAVTGEVADLGGAVTVEVQALAAPAMPPVACCAP